MVFTCDARALYCCSLVLWQAIHTVTKVELRAKKEVVVIGIIVWSLLRDTLEAPNVQLATKGRIPIVLEESWKDDLFHLLHIMSPEAATVGLPRDDFG